ncbi:hypothetical protein DV736_g4128, partial [Chaetothyriales sp. CBS 134916]
MSDIIKEGEQVLNNSQGQGNDQSQGNDKSQQQSSDNSSGGGFVSNTEDAYINNAANSFLTKEGVPSAVDGAIDGAIDTEINKYKKDF